MSDKIINSTDKRKHNGPTKSTAEIRRGSKRKDISKKSGSENNKK